MRNAPWFYSNAELRIGNLERQPGAPTSRFALRSEPRASKRPFFLPPLAHLGPPAFVLSLRPLGGAEALSLEDLSRALDAERIEAAEWLQPPTLEEEAIRTPAAWIEGIEEAAFDAQARALGLRDGLRIDAEGLCHPLGSGASSGRYLVPLPRVVLEPKMLLADNTDPRLSMEALFLEMTEQFGRGKAFKHIRLATGYLYKSGIYPLLKALEREQEPIESMKILFSGQTSRTTANLLTNVFRSHIAAEVEANQDDQFAEKLRIAAESGRLEVRVYPDVFLHAKLFIGTNGLDTRDALDGRAVIGSSNLSSKGLGHGGNLELDITVNDHRTVDDLRHWFDHRWIEAELPDPALLEVIDSWKPKPPPTFKTQGLLDVWKSGLTGKLNHPREYLLWLANHYNKRLKRVNTLDLQAYPDIPERRIDPSPEQIEGVRSLEFRLRHLRVGFLADSVGLGKTITALGVGWYLQRAGEVEHFAIIAPRKLHGQWHDDAAAIGLNPMSFERISRHALERREVAEALADLSPYQLLLVDEAHEALRSRKNKLWRHLRAWLAGDLRRKLLLISATPWNNSREDIYSYLALPWREQQLLFDLYPQLEAAPLHQALKLFERTDRAHARQFNELDQKRYEQIFGAVFIQRTRHTVTRKHGGSDFPERRIHAHETPPSLDHEKFFKRLNKTLQRLHIPYREPFTAMQRALSAINSAHAAPPASNLHGSFVLQLYKRAESSLYALAASLSGVERRLEDFATTLESIEASEAPREELRKWLREVYLKLSELDEEAEEEEPQPLSRAERLRHDQLEALIGKLSDDDARKAARHLIDAEIRADQAEIDKLKSTLNADLDQRDPNQRTLLGKANTHLAQGHKPILIAAYADTALRAFIRCVERFPEARIGLALGAGEGWLYQPSAPPHLTPERWRESLSAEKSADRRKLLLGQDKRAISVPRTQILEAFAPKAKNALSGSALARWGEIDILIGSEAISVGQNLQDSTALIHLDLPWNPMILEQRIGRVDRRGGGRHEQGHSKRVVDVHYCWTMAAVEAEVKLRDKLLTKTRGALQDTRFDELLLNELAEEVQQARNAAERRDIAARVFSQSQQEQAEKQARVEGTDPLSSAELDGLRRLAAWAEEQTAEATPVLPVIACAQEGAGEGLQGSWLISLKLTPLGETGRPLGSSLSAHVVVPSDQRLEGRLHADLDGVVTGLLGGSLAPSKAGEGRERWTTRLSQLDEAIEAARRRTLFAHNAEIEQRTEALLSRRAPQDGSEALKRSVSRAAKAVFDEARRDKSLRKSSNAERIKYLLGGPLKSENAWRLLEGHEEAEVLEHLELIANRPHWFWREGFEVCWSALFEDLTEEASPQMELEIISTDRKWHDLRAEIQAASWIKDPH